MKGNQKYDNGRQLHTEDYLQENKLETKGNVEVSSIFTVPSLGNKRRKVETKTTHKILSKAKEKTKTLSYTRKSYQLICKTDWLKFAINIERLIKNYNYSKVINKHFINKLI